MKSTLCLVARDKNGHPVAARFTADICWMSMHTGQDTPDDLPRELVEVCMTNEASGAVFHQVFPVIQYALDSENPVRWLWRKLGRHFAS